MENLIKCKACGNEIAKNAKVCPSCGAKNKKPLYKAWLFWVIVVFVVGSLVFGGKSNEKNVQTTDNIDASATTIVPSQIDDEAIEFIIDGGVLGDLGKKVVLNKNTDFPTTKYLYKLPAGKYEVSVVEGKIVQFSICKDNTVESGSSDYPEELSYVGSPYLLTSTDDNLNGKAQKALKFKLLKMKVFY